MKFVCLFGVSSSLRICFRPPKYIGKRELQAKGRERGLGSVSRKYHPALSTEAQQDGRYSIHLPGHTSWQSSRLKTLWMSQLGAHFEVLR